MAVEKRKHRFDEVIEPARKSDMEALVLHIKDNPLLYGAAVLVILLAALAGVFYRASSEQKLQEVATVYAKALENEDPGLRATELEQIEAQGTALEAEVKYMLGEAAYQAEDLDKAKQAFKTVVDKHATSPYAPKALEGLGSIAEDEDKPEQALEYYQQIVSKYGTDFTASIQQLNIGRVQEKLGKFKEAFDAYTQQNETFPASHAAEQARAALDKLRAAHPDLFPAEVPAEAPAEAPAAPTTEGAELPLPEPVAAPEAAPVAVEPAAPEAAPVAVEPAAPEAAPEAAPAETAAPAPAPEATPEAAPAAQ